VNGGPGNRELSKSAKPGFLIAIANAEWIINHYLAKRIWFGSPHQERFSYRLP